MKKFIILFFMLLMAFTVFCEHAPKDNGIIAYPVPFNPGTQTLKIGYKDTPMDVDKVSLDILDNNEDLVFHEDAASLNSPIIWNGRNQSGLMVDSGEYIIKIIVKNTQTGYYAKSIIKIQVDR